MGKLNNMIETDNLFNLQNEAKRIKRELELIHVIVESDGIKITVSGAQDIIKVEITNDEILKTVKKAENVFRDVANKAMKKSQKISAEKMKSLMGGML